MKNTKGILEYFLKKQDDGEIISLEFINDYLGADTENFLKDIFHEEKNNVSVYEEYLIVSHPRRKYFLIVKISSPK
jgi:hypothetical protein